MISTLDAHSFGSEQIFDFTKSCSDVTRLAKRTLADCTHFFCERHAEEYSEVLHFFRGIFVQILHELRAPRQTRTFSDLKQNYDLFKSCSDVTIFLCSERWPSTCNFFCTRRAEIPEVLQFFRGIFGQNLHDLDAARLLF